MFIRQQKKGKHTVDIKRNNNNKKFNQIALKNAQVCKKPFVNFISYKQKLMELEIN